MNELTSCTTEVFSADMVVGVREMRTLHLRPSVPSNVNSCSGSGRTKGSVSNSASTSESLLLEAQSQADCAWSLGAASALTVVAALPETGCEPADFETENGDGGAADGGADAAADADATAEAEAEAEDEAEAEAEPKAEPEAEAEAEAEDASAAG